MNPARLRLSDLPERAQADLVTIEARGYSNHALYPPLIYTIPEGFENPPAGLEIYTRADGTYDPEILGSVGYIREGSHPYDAVTALREAQAFGGLGRPEDLEIDFADPAAHLSGAWLLTEWLGLPQPATSAFVARDAEGWCLYADGIGHRWMRTRPAETRAWTCGLPLSFAADLELAEDTTLNARERNGAALASLIRAHAQGAGYDRKSRLRMAAESRGT